MAYSIGTISIQQHHSIITGYNTLFVQVAKAQVGDLLYFRMNEQDVILQLTEVINDAQLRVAMLDGQAFSPALSVNNLGYGLVQNFTATISAKLAKGITDLQTKWHKRERELTGWFASTNSTYPITTFLGEQTVIPTPTKIAQLAQVAMSASADLATMATAIECNKQSLATVEPRIAQFDAIYPQVITASNSVTTKHDEVVTAHAAVQLHANTIAEQAQQIRTAQQVVFSLKADIEQAAQQVDLDQAHSQAAAALCSAAHAQTSENTALVVELNEELTALGDSLFTTFDDVNAIASSAREAQTVTQNNVEQTGLDALHSNANAALAALCVTEIINQNQSINHAFSAMLAGTLTLQKVNELFPA